MDELHSETQEGYMYVWFKTCCRRGPQEVVALGNLYLNYRDNCYLNETVPFSKRFFAKHLEKFCSLEKGYPSLVRTRTSKVFYQGVSIKPPAHIVTATEAGLDEQLPGEL